MKKSEVKAVVVGVLQEVVDAIGVKTPPFKDDMCPIGALPHFDSILAEDTTVQLFRRLGLESNDDVNPFVRNRRACTLADVVDSLHALAAKTKA
jgi:hypothetical protein